MKKLIYLLGALTIVGIFSSCKNNDNSSTNLACPTGTTYYNGACYTGAGTYVAGAGYSYANGFYADSYSGTSQYQVVNSGAMANLLRNGMGVCDTAGGANYGQAACSSWATGPTDLIIQFPPSGGNSLLATFTPRPSQNSGFNYSAQLPSGWGALGLALGWVTGIYLPDPSAYHGLMKWPLQLELAVSAINNSQGFSANGYGDYLTGLSRTKITIEVANGKMQDNQLAFIFKVGDIPAAQGVFTRCQTLNCGLQ